MGHYIGIEIGGTNFRIGLIDSGGNLKFSLIESTKIFFGSGNPLSNIYEYLLNYIQKNGIDKLDAICIGVPSTISKDKKTIVSTPNIEGFNNVDIVEYLENKMKIKVFLDRDVNLLLMRDITELSINREELTIGIYFGTGIGNSIYINGDFLCGKNGVAGEIGHIPLGEKNKLCGCGNYDCAECYASGTALLKISEEIECKDISNVFERYINNYRVRNFIDDMSRVIANEINILNPHNIILGGGIIWMKDFPKELLKEHIVKYLRKPFPANDIELIYSVEDKFSGVYGAGYLLLEKL